MSKKSRKQKDKVEEKAAFEWEKDRILPENLRDEMETMWEIPQIYHFLQLTKKALNICHLSMYEVERMLLMPKASKQLAHIMTCLLSSPSSTKTKLHRLPSMPYEFWTNILSYKLKSWFKIYQAKREDFVKTFDTLGVEPEFWKVFPEVNKIEGKEFQDFTFRERVWILKTICDTVAHSRKTIQDELAKQPWESQFETVLGIDRYGARYIYFPQFLDNDLRVYRHCLDNQVLSTVKPLTKILKPKEQRSSLDGIKVGQRITSKKKKRRTRWSTGSLPRKKRDKRKSDVLNVDQNVIDSNSNSVDSHCKNSSRSSSKASERSVLAKSCFTNDSVVAKQESNFHQIKSEIIDNLKMEAEENNKKTEGIVVKDDLNKSVKTFFKTEDSFSKESNFLAIDDLSKSSKTDDEKLEEMSSLNASKNSDNPGDMNVQLFLSLEKDVNISKSDDEKLSENKKCDASSDNEFLIDELSLDKWRNMRKPNIDGNLTNSDTDDVCNLTLNNSRARRSARIKHISEIKSIIDNPEDTLESCKSEDLSSIDLRDRLCRASPELDENYLNEHLNGKEWKVRDFNELINDLSISNFQLVADSIDSLNGLIEFITSDKRIPDFNTIKDNFVRPASEEKLLIRMKILFTYLRKMESTLKESTKKARNKLQREWNNFENGVADEVEEDKDGSNHWVVGSQGYSLHVLDQNRSSALSHSASSSAGSRKSGSKAIAGASFADTFETPASAVYNRKGRRKRRRRSRTDKVAICKTHFPAKVDKADEAGEASEASEANEANEASEASEVDTADKSKAEKDGTKRSAENKVVEDQVGENKVSSSDILENKVDNDHANGHANEEEETNKNTDSGGNALRGNLY